MAALKSWFPTQIYHAPLLRATAAAARFRRELERECHQYRELDDAGQKWSRRNYPGGYTSYGSLDKLHRLGGGFADLERHLQRHARTFSRSLDWDLGQAGLVLTDCWINIMPTGVVHSLHLHPLSTLSGTLYLRVPRGAPGLKLEDPRLDRFMAAPPRRADAARANQCWVTLPARVGDIVMFESWLRHEVPPNTAAGERVSVSFNYGWF